MGIVAKNESELKRSEAGGGKDLTNAEAAEAGAGVWRRRRELRAPRKKRIEADGLTTERRKEAASVLAPLACWRVGVYPRTAKSG
jgi:hypothetical protein